MSATILIVDDDAILAGLLQLTLQLEGYDVDVAENGQIGLDAVAGRRFDLILLDLLMPDVDGIKFLRLLADTAGHRPPVMIVSSAIEEHLTDRLRAFGVVDVARKPVEPADLVERVGRALAQDAEAVSEPAERD